MKISRNDPVRRRRSPLSTLLIVIATLLAGIIALGWINGAPQATHQVEIPIPANRLGR